MRPSFVIRVALLALAALLTERHGIAAPPLPVERLVMFGDSSVDNGNLFRMTGGKIPSSPPNWQGRFSNGPNVAEFLAKGLGAKLQNYAVSGATTGTDGFYASTGVRSQIDQFINKDAGKLGPKDVVVLWAGSNDINGVQDGAALAKAINGASANISASIDRLYRVGARRILVANRAPTLNSDDALKTIDLNKAIAVAVTKAAKRTGASIYLFDANGTIADMMHNPARYNFVQVGAPCDRLAACRDEKYEAGLKVSNEYIFWDAAGHKTTRVHALMAEKILGMLKP